MAEKSDTAGPPVRMGAAELARYMSGLFAAAGLSDAAAGTIGEALVEADLQGLPSHGVLQAEAYLERLRAGTVSPKAEGEIVHREGAVAILDAGNILGHLSASQAMALAIELAREHGIGAVAVRNGFHFGAAGRYARQAAEAGCVGIAMSNTRAVMPAPGGAAPLVGTNPLAVGLPTAEPPDIVFDMATTEGSVGRIRVAQRAGRPIPPTWAVDADGAPTTDPAAALKGMLLPAAGPKGFGLALVIDLLAGLLSGGGRGADVGAMREDLDRPVNGSHLFIAMNVAAFRPLDAFRAEASAAAAEVRGSKRAPGTDRIYVPGERKWEAARSSGDVVSLGRAQVAALARLGAGLGVAPPEAFREAGD